MNNDRFSKFVRLLAFCRTLTFVCPSTPLSADETPDLAALYPPRLTDLTIRQVVDDVAFSYVPFALQALTRLELVCSKKHHDISEDTMLSFVRNLAIFTNLKSLRLGGPALIPAPVTSNVTLW